MLADEAGSACIRCCCDLRLGSGGETPGQDTTSQHYSVTSSMCFSPATQAPRHGLLSVLYRSYIGPGLVFYWSYIDQDTTSQHHSVTSCMHIAPAAQPLRHGLLSVLYIGLILVQFWSSIGLTLVKTLHHTIIVLLQACTLLLLHSH